MTTASLVNSIHARTVSPDPEVGMGATVLMWTDRKAATIIAVSPSGTRIKVREDLATRSDDNGMSDAQSYDYAPNPEGAVTEFSLRDNGRWIRKGEPMRSGQALLVGQRDHHFDFSF
jgi:hypothetical protein